MPAARVGRFRFFLSTDDLPIPLGFTSILHASLFAVFVPCLLHAHVLFEKYFRAACAADIPTSINITFLLGYILAALFGLQLISS
eukprot:scaffold651446_cov47-Prasinocladus_malaysianus.AAC.1